MEIWWIHTFGNIWYLINRVTVPRKMVLITDEQLYSNFFDSNFSVQKYKVELVQSRRKFH